MVNYDILSSSLPLSSFFSSPPITIFPHFPIPISPASSSVPTSNASSNPLTPHLFMSPPLLKSSHVNRRPFHALTLTSHISPSTILLLIESQLRKVCSRGVLISSNYEGWRLSVVLVLDFDSFLLVWRCFVFSLFGSCIRLLFLSCVFFYPPLPFSAHPSPFILHPRTFKPVLDPSYVLNLLPFIFYYISPFWTT